MDVISQLLLYFDGVALSWMKKDKRFIESYYDLATPISDTTIRMKNGSLVSVFSLGGMVNTLNDFEKKEVSRQMVRDLDFYFKKLGFTFQIVDWVDPEINERRINATMKSSIEELARMGLSDPMFAEDYVKFVSSKSKWQEQYLVVITNPVALEVSNNEADKELSESQLDLLDAQDMFVKHGMKADVNEQPLFLSEQDLKLFSLHDGCVRRCDVVFKSHGMLIDKMYVSNFIKTQREILWSARGTSEDWQPNLTGAAVVKQNQAESFKQSKLKMGNIPSQVLTSGAELSKSGMNVVSLGGRFFRTINMVLPQNDIDNLKSYEALLNGVSTKSSGYLVSYRIDTEPLKTGEFKTQRMYAMLCSILPYSNNMAIKKAQDEIIKRHESGERSVYFQLTITMYSRTEAELDKIYNDVISAANNWGQATFADVEMEPIDGLFSSLPATSALPRLTQVLEDAYLSFYMSPLFVDCRLYNQGYLHFYTKNNRPFPLEEHSSKNVNFNSGAFGAPGTGKSTLLTMQNIALLAKPKTDASLSGEFPLIFNTDFGQTSFGLNETLKELLLERAKKNNDRNLQAKALVFLNHNMETAMHSAWNPHDLPIGRTMPTMRHKTMLAGFLQVMLFGVNKDPRTGRFEMPKEAASFSNMLEVLIDSVYKFRSDGDTPHRFNSSEFSIFKEHQQAIAHMVKIGLLKGSDNPDAALKYVSYYALSVKLMELSLASPDKQDHQRGLYYAKVLRRFAVPRLSDYAALLSEKTNFQQLYAEKVKPFLELLTDSIQRYPCFNSVTRIPIDMARVISIDIDSVVGDDDSRKALFGSMTILMYLVKRENEFESKDLFDDNVDKIFMPYLEHLDKINRRLPSILNLEESHILMSLFDGILCSYQRRNRKVNWGLKSFSQNIDDPSSEYLSLCSSIFITSDMSSTKQLPILRDDLRLSVRNQEIVKSGIGADPTSMFVIIRTKSPGKSGSDENDDSSQVSQNPPVAMPLRLYLPGSFLWASTADAVDRDFKREAIKRYGFTQALKALSQKLPNGSSKYLLESEPLRQAISKFRHANGEPVYKGTSDFLMDYLSMSERPKWLPMGIL